jgi:PERQ amino acid-rich with GYF domain-containing protein
MQFHHLDAFTFFFIALSQIASKASVRVKRVMAAISFIGVSIFSSAITTILAILPLVGTEIQLFARFGEILLIDTAVAIVYTLIICGNCLGFFGPPLTERLWKKVLNAVLTIFFTFVFYVILVVALFAASRSGVYIPSPQGGELFG